MKSKISVNIDLYLSYDSESELKETIKTLMFKLVEKNNLSRGELKQGKVKINHKLHIVTGKQIGRAHV